MKYEKKLKIRLYTYIAIGIIGLGLIVLGNICNHDMVLSFGSVYVVLALARLLQYRRITKDADTLHKREIAETDERNVLLWTKARSLSFSVYILLASIMVCVLYALKIDAAARLLAYNLFGFVFIYWICYFIIRKKY